MHTYQAIGYNDDKKHDIVFPHTLTNDCIFPRSTRLPNQQHQGQDSPLASTSTCSNVMSVPADTMMQQFYHDLPPVVPVASMINSDSDNQ